MAEAKKKGRVEAAEWPCAARTFRRDLDDARDAHQRRPDFTLAEMKVAADLFENVSPVRAFMITLFPPGSLRATYFLERREAGVWGFYGISSTSDPPLAP